MDKKAWHLFIFTAGVMMLLLRPYMVYQLTQKTLENDPGKAYSLLQRLVKKKDDHHGVFDTAAIKSPWSGIIFRNPVLWLKRFCKHLFLLFAMLPLLMAGLAFQVRPPNHRYCLLSCFRI